ncbi:Crp/Fnr family transcriptional regulator [Rhodopseudomonas palustris]|nr:Crp/Fnr family transcriptional regulator [Rhodopseudomonas palustris]OPF90638.1 Crp/Fnr family transcriptional regulator [Rhodopseudomonas palustris]PPQ43064.1 Crp/Fnr family transcriptional regulator [Rhodopseudomonas palustris]QQM03587.1 Anaerobic regulatory protein [Rhodopseudomonas palustris]RJF61681.1 Crp/Fnr family transcriptional regulator [Rhodopseudomonas palustris]
MVHPFLRKLRHGARLTKDSEEILLRLTQSSRCIGAREDLVPVGGQPHYLPLLVEGWACRYTTLENGRRQIISLFLPGDLCEPFGALPRFMDHPIGTLTPAVIARVRTDAVRNAAQLSPRIEEALWWDLLVASAIEREHLVSLGRRTATERLGHLFCELHLRLGLVGLVDEDELSYEMPITQADLGDLLGMSMVHINRSLQELRRTGMISLRGRRLTIHSLEGLRELSFFDAGYLHLFGPLSLLNTDGSDLGTTTR